MKARSFGQRLRALREAKELSTAELARLAGSSRQNVLRLEKDERAPGWELACRLADALGVSLEEFRK